MPELDKQAIDQMLRSYFADLLSKSEEIAFLAPQDPQFDWDLEIDGSETAMSQLQQQLGTGQIDGLTAREARKLAEHFIGDGVQVPHDELRVLCNGILRARIENHRVLVAMLRGKYDETEPRDPMFQGVRSTGLPSLPGEKPPAKSLSLASTIQKYRDHKSAHDWVSKTAAESARVLHWFEESVGASRPLTSLTVEDVREFRDALLKLPKHASTAIKSDGATFHQLVSSSSEAPRLSPGTLAKYYNVIRSFLSWCDDEYGIDSSPMLKIKLGQKVDKSNARDPFSVEQLRTLFKSPQYTGHRSIARRAKPGELIVRDGKFWLPMLGLYTGMRLGELVQLVASDVREENGIVYIDVNKNEDDVGKSLKTATSKRRIPVHPVLLQTGFLDHVADTNPSGRLFPEIKKGANGYYSHNISKYLGRYFRAIGIKTARTSFHSLRHNFADALREAEVEDSHIKTLLGHSDTSTTAIYGSGVSLKVLTKDIERVRYDLDFNHLKIGGADG